MLSLHENSKLGFISINRSRLIIVNVPPIMHSAGPILTVPLTLTSEILHCHLIGLLILYNKFHWYMIYQDDIQLGP